MVEEAISTPMWRRMYAASLLEWGGWMSVVWKKWLKDGEVGCVVYINLKVEKNFRG